VDGAAAHVMARRRLGRMPGGLATAGGEKGWRLVWQRRMDWKRMCRGRRRRAEKKKKRGEKRALKNPFPREETDDPGRPRLACGGGFGGLPTALVEILLEFEF